MVKIRLRASAFTQPWIQWADDQQVLIVEHPEFVPSQWWAKVWEVRPTIWGPSTVTGNAEDASILVHEIQHLLEGPTCVTDPWSHQRAFFAQWRAAKELGASEGYIQALYGQEQRYRLETVSMEELGRTDPCDKQASPEKYHTPLTKQRTPATLLTKGNREHTARPGWGAPGFPFSVCSRALEYNY